MTIDIPFAEMPVPVLSRWQAWARSHDWGYDAQFNTALTALTGCVEHWSDGSSNIAPAFTTPRALLDWAGY